ncbi:MAG: RluA family pseudouridine synthase [Trueperaceae bacterium]|nr:RluA family pseudouridine synthase [Trueperaceae bacterium]
MNSGYTYREQLGKKARGHTVLSYLSSYYRHSSPGQWQERIERAEVFVNEKRANANDLLKAGEVLSWRRPPWQEEEVPKTFDLIYEDSDVLLVAKPSGLPTVPAGGFLENTLVHLVKSLVPEANPVHRLGRATSGLVLFSKTRQGARGLGKGWEQEVEKIYLALAEGSALKGSYMITEKIGPVNHTRLGTVHAANSLGKPSLSEAWVLARRDGQTLFKVRLGTGRPHQIRIHLAAIGHPLTGDPLYARGGQPLANAGLPGEGGYYLHAHTLEFKHPRTGQRLRFEAIPPEVLSLDNFAVPQ